MSPCTPSALARLHLFLLHLFTLHPVQTFPLPGGPQTKCNLCLRTFRRTSDWLLVKRSGKSCKICKTRLGTRSDNSPVDSGGLLNEVRRSTDFTSPSPFTFALHTFAPSLVSFSSFGPSLVAFSPFGPSLFYTHYFDTYYPQPMGSVKICR